MNSNRRLKSNEVKVNGVIVSYEIYAESGATIFKEDYISGDKYEVVLDEFGRIVKETKSNCNAPGEQSEFTTYTRYGNLQSCIKYDGSGYEIDYDDLGQIVSEKTYFPNRAPRGITKTVYEADGSSVRTETYTSIELGGSSLCKDITIKKAFNGKDVMISETKKFKDDVLINNIVYNYNLGYLTSTITRDNHGNGEDTFYNKYGQVERMITTDGKETIHHREYYEVQGE